MGLEESRLPCKVRLAMSEFVSEGSADGLPTNGPASRARAVVEQILQRYGSGELQVEGVTVELKAQFPGRGQWQEQTAKTVGALLNSCLDVPGYMVFGVSEETRDLCDIGIVPDESVIQTQLRNLIDPVPDILVCDLVVDEKRVVVMEVQGSPACLPYVVKWKDQGVVWVRQGSVCRSATHDELLQLVLKRSDPEFQAHRQALADFDIRKREADLRSGDWERTEAALADLDQYADPSLYGPAVRALLIEGLDLALMRARADMPVRLVESVASLASRAGTYRVRSRPSDPHREEVEILHRILEIGTGLAYHGMKYRGNVAVVDAGVRMMADTLRAARSWGLDDVASETRAEFEDRLKWANDVEAVLLRWRRDTAEGIKHDDPTVIQAERGALRRVDRDREGR